jgi:DNA-3-methyladenine glycosylase II
MSRVAESPRQPTCTVNAVQSRVVESFAECPRYTLRVGTPFRLDLTASALRRLSSNRVDVYTADGAYVRALDGATGPTVVCVTQPRADALFVTMSKTDEHAVALDTVHRMLGTGCDVQGFAGDAERLSWLAPLVRRMRGLKPPRYPTIWEACVNAIVFQQISLHAASAIMGRLVLALGDSTAWHGIPLVVFPKAKRFLDASDAALRAAGLSAGKVATLRRAAEALASGTVTEAMLEERPSAEAGALLRGIKGIGPWTATVILLRGLGRLDLFPRNDSGVAASLAFVASEPVDSEAIVTVLGSQRGMLYFHLLLARLEARGEIGRPSDVVKYGSDLGN